MQSQKPRAIFEAFKNKVVGQKVLILLGARRVGKTELIKSYLDTLDKSTYMLFNGEDHLTSQLFAERSVANYQRILGDCKLLVIDEAQKIPDIGLKLKLMVDSIDNLKIVVTGSSTFDLHNKLGEPLVGRANPMHLYPLAQMEFGIEEQYAETVANLEERLVFGGYPELMQYKSWQQKAEYLDNLVNAYLLRDILEYESVKKSNKLLDLLRLIAYQVGNEVKLDELASSLKGISRNTVERYLDLLSKVFVLYNIRGFSRNLRKEITKTSRWYFYDNGIRNAVIRNYGRLNQRQDTGQLWENYLMSERIKFNDYNQKMVDSYFWRTYDQQEIDLIEQHGEALFAFEFKYNKNKEVKPPGGWTRAYPDAAFQTIHQNNYLEFIT